MHLFRGMFRSVKVMGLDSFTKSLMMIVKSENEWQRR